MDCNKDEAIRARGIAEKKMLNNDFGGARKIALKAQQLFPELENTSQMLAVCDVHISAQNRICGSEKDWYGILQIERLANEATIRKQYRKLALILHPDKNRFPGAEAAFKLIGEANMVLSDQQKRSLYDSKCRIPVKSASAKPPPHQVNRNPAFQRQYGGQNNAPNLYNYQPRQPNLSNGQQAFWTCCPFCNVKYQYQRDFLNKALLCQKCLKPFVAYESAAPGAPSGSGLVPPATRHVPPGSNQGRPSISQQKQFPNQEPSKVGLQGTGAFTSFPVGSQGSACNRNTENGEAGIGVPNFDAVKLSKQETSKKATKKRERKLIVESSESSDGLSSLNADGVVIEENGANHAAGQSSGLNDHCRRRSSRQRQHVSYNENESDDDLSSLPKRSRSSEIPLDSKGKQKEAAFCSEKAGDSNMAGDAATAKYKGKNNKKNSIPPEGSLPDMKGGTDNNKVKREEPVADKDAKNFEVLDESESNADSADTSVPLYYDCLEPEFNDFDKFKEENCFSADQFWACYDMIDGMPRFYAWVRKVFPHEFKVRITWLEADPEEGSEIAWAEGGLPVACGKFILGTSEETSDRLTFSHPVYFEKGRTKRSYVIYPKKGETWALFKDWDIGWISEAENHKNYQFEFVEILSNFVEDVGIEVAYIYKVKGFVSLFQRGPLSGDASFMISPCELLKFSHQVPSFRLTGSEREGVPEGSFELDPASLPTKIDEFCHSKELKTETKSVDAKVNGSCPKSPVRKDKSKLGSERISTPKKSGDFNEENNVQTDASKLRRSPRIFSSTDKKLNQANAS